MVKQAVPQKRSPWILIALVILGLGVLSMILAGFIGLLVGVDASSSPIGGNVALIEVDGPILTMSNGIFSGAYASSEDIVSLVEKADRDGSIKAIVLSINSPGGSAVASDEIAHAIQKSNKTSVAMIRDIGTSGAYWVASSTDRIVAHPASFTGSIGVIASYVEAADLMTEYNLTYRRLVAGKYKDMGSPLKHMTSEEEAMFQSSLDELHTLFIRTVAQNRNMSEEDVRNLATGAFYTGIRAKDLGLVDELGGKEEVEAYLAEKLGTKVTFVPFKKKKTVFDIIAQTSSDQSFRIGQGIGSVFLSQNDVPMPRT